MLSVSDLPLTNALLNGASTILLLTGYYFIRTKDIHRHRLCMIAAFCTSIIFLFSYVIYHAEVGSVHFTGLGWIRPVYFSILLTHTALATVLPILAAITLFRALKRRFSRHRALARWTFPIWLYVSFTGVVIYLLLYRIYPSI